MVLLAGCLFDRGGLPAGSTDGETSREGPPADQAPHPSDGSPRAEAHPPGDQSLDRDLRLDTPADTVPLDVNPCGGLSCPLGCNVAAQRCNRLKPSNFDPTSFYAAIDSAGALTLGSDTTFNAETGLVQAGSQVLRAAGGDGNVVGGIFWKNVDQGGGYPHLGIFGVTSLIVPVSTKLLVAGKAALLLYATHAATVQGTVVAASSGQTGGPGGRSGGNAGANGASCQGGEGGKGLSVSCPGSSASQCKSGGGGGGRKAAGGSGADSTGGVSGSAAGGAGGSPNGITGLSPLYGGCGGGGGGGANGCGGAGGGGGGAVQIAAETIDIGGVINTAGAGGRGSGSAMTPDGFYCGGGGGGSGGAILLEGATVKVSGSLVANGGGGGGAGNGGKDGAAGPASAANAAGGSAGGYGTVGGAGGSLAPQGGSPGGTTSAVGYNPHGGGGGGGAGRIRVNASNSSFAGATVSPAVSPGPLPGTW